LLDIIPVFVAFSQFRSRFSEFNTLSTDFSTFFLWMIDLASRPGGTDFDAAKRLGIRVVWALALPPEVRRCHIPEKVVSAEFHRKNVRCVPHRRRRDVAPAAAAAHPVQVVLGKAVRHKLDLALFHALNAGLARGPS